jgi:hypothetical protein
MGKFINDYDGGDNGAKQRNVDSSGYLGQMSTNRLKDFWR